MKRPTIAVVLAQFLAEQEQRLAPKTVAQYRDVVELLQHDLNGYAYLSLGELDAKRFELRAQRVPGHGTIERGDHADLVIGKKTHDAREVILVHTDVAVVDENMIEARVRKHLDETGDFAVRAENVWTDDELDAARGKLPTQHLDVGHGGIEGVGHAEDELVLAGILLQTVRAKRVELIRVGAAKGLKDGNRR